MDDTTSVHDACKVESHIQQWSVLSTPDETRLDKYVTSMLQDISRSQVQLWISQGNITVNGMTVKSNHKIMSGDCVHLCRPQDCDLDVVAEAIPLEIMYEDVDVIVVNKRRGMVVHPAPGHSSGTLVHALLHHCQDFSGIQGKLRPGIVHRIDKDTSGLLMVAKHDRAHRSLCAQLKEHNVLRRYIALVHGHVGHDEGTIDAPIGRDVCDRKMYAVKATNSKHAVTHFAVRERIGDYTLLELKLETGRTHQIRVHMKFIGHPIVGDPIYGRHSKAIAINGQALHAAVLGFVHPRTGRHMQFCAPLPDDMEHLLATLRRRYA